MIRARESRAWRPDPEHIRRFAAVFVVLFAGGMIFGGLAVGFGASFWWVLLVVTVLAALIAASVTR